MKNNDTSIVMTKDVFDFLSTGVYNMKDDKFKYFYAAEKFGFLVSLQLSNLSENRSNECQNLIYSSMMFSLDLDYEKIVEGLAYKDYSNDLYIIKVSWLNSMSLSEVNNAKSITYRFNNVFGNEYKLNVINLSYPKFFKLLDKLPSLRSDIEKDKGYNYLGINPIIHFKGMTMSNITHLFKLHNFSLNGGTISHRHKLTLAQLRLSIFLQIINEVKSKDLFLERYTEKLYSSKIIARGEENPHVKQYKSINFYIKLHLDICTKENELTQKEEWINKTKIEIQSLESELSNYASEHLSNLGNISYLNKKLSEGDNHSKRRNATLKGKIKKYKDAINEMDISQVNSRINKKIFYLNKAKEEVLGSFNLLKSEVNTLNLKLNEIRSEIIDVDKLDKSNAIEIDKLLNKNTDSSSSKVINSEEGISKDSNISESIHSNSSNNKSHSNGNSIYDTNNNSYSNNENANKENSSVGIYANDIKGYINNNSSESISNSNFNNKYYNHNTGILIPKSKFSLGYSPKDSKGYHSFNLTLNLKGNTSNTPRVCGVRSFSIEANNKLNFNINSPIFLELQRIINNSPLDSNTQMKIEHFLNNQGYILLKNRIDQNSDINYYRINNFIVEYLKKSIVELEKLIDNYRSNVINFSNKDNSEKIEHALITKLPNETIIAQLLGRLLRIISNNHLINRNTNSIELASDLGSSLLFSLYSEEYKKKYGSGSGLESVGLSKFVETECSELTKLTSESVLIQIGLKLLNFLIEVGLIKSEILILDKEHKSHIYVATSKIQDDLGKSLDLLSISYKIPMIVPPKRYGYDLKTKTEILGGYLLNDKNYIIPLIIKNQELKEQSQINELNVIYDGINNLSSVGYKINTQVLNFILEFGLEFNLISDHNLKHPLELKKRGKKKLTLLETKNLDSFLSHKQLEMNILGLALIFKSVPEFFIPVRLDNRGRIYCMVDYLHYQGIELAKSLLLFSKGDKIDKCDNKSIDYLKIFGANCYGNGVDKKSYTDRVDWVNKNEEDILNFRNGKLIKLADSKLLFVAFCFEYLNYHNSLFNTDSFYVSHFPIQLDATCNGYQHLSLLTGDEPLAGQLNLISGDEDSIPNDFYSFVALKINDYLNIRLLEEKHNLKKYTSNSNSISYPCTANPKVSTDIILNTKPIQGSKDSNLPLIGSDSFYDADSEFDYLVTPLEKETKQKLNTETEKQQKVSEILNIIESCERLLKLNVSRTLVKLPIMVKPYNASFFKMVEYVKEKFVKITQKYNNEDGLYEKTLKEFNTNDKVFFLYKSKTNDTVILNNFDLNLFISTLEKVIYNEFPKLKEFNSYLSKVAEICSILNITITWTLPSGLNVKQFYVDSEAIRLKPFKYKKSTFTLKIKTNRVNKNKQVRALMPNLIHSLDAASLALILDRFYLENQDKNNKINFFAIHDCFAVTSKNITSLIKTIKLVYIKIYSEDSYLKKFDEGIINSIKYQFGHNAFNDETNIISVHGYTLHYPDVNQVILGKIKAGKILKSQFIIN